MAINREDADAIAAAIRRGNRAHSNWSAAGDPDPLDDLPLDPSTPEGRREYLKTPEGRAEASVAKLIAAQDERHDAFESGVALDDEGLPLEPVGVDELAEQIDALRAKRDATPAQFEMLDFQLDQLVRRRATMNLTVLMEEQDERRQEELEEREAELEDGSEVFP